MNRIYKNQKGFSGVEVILIVVIVALIGVVGWLIYKDNNKTKTTNIATTSSNSSTNKSATPTTTKTSTSTPTTPSQPTTSSATTVFKIPQLGIQITVPSSLSTLTYYYLAQYSTADFSTSTLAARASSCTANSSTDNANYDALGSLTKGQGIGKSQPDVTIEKQYSTYYIAYNEPQDTCLPSSSSNSLENLLTGEQRAFQSSLSTIQPIQ